MIWPGFVASSCQPPSPAGHFLVASEYQKHVFRKRVPFQYRRWKTVPVAVSGTPLLFNLPSTMVQMLPSSSTIFAAGGTSWPLGAFAKASRFGAAANNAAVMQTAMVAVILLRSQAIMGRETAAG